MTHGGDGGEPGTPFGGDPFGGDPFAGDPFAVGRPGASASQAPASQQQETNTLATLSVVFAFVFAPAGVILGHLALSQIHKTGGRGRDRALVGVTLHWWSRPPAFMPDNRRSPGLVANLKVIG